MTGFEKMAEFRPEPEFGASLLQSRQNDEYDMMIVSNK